MNFGAVVLVILVVGVVVLVVRAGQGGSADFTIRHRPGRRVSVRGRIPLSKVGAIQEFFDRDLDAGRAVTVRGSRDPARGWRLTISGGLDTGHRQQIRNFLTELLR